MWEKEKERAFARVAAEHQRQYEILHADPPRRSAQDFSGMAFNIGLPSGEMARLIEQDPQYFRQVYNIAVQRGLSWQEAEKEYKKQITEQEEFLDRVGRSLESRYRDPPRSAQIFQEFHKRRKPPTKAQIAKRAADYLKWKKAADVLNTEEATPLDS